MRKLLQNKWLIAAATLAMTVASTGAGIKWR